MVAMYFAWVSVYPVLYTLYLFLCPVVKICAAIGTGRNAKRTTIIHLSFNLIGTVVFTVLCMTTPLVSLVAQLTPGRTERSACRVQDGRI